MESLDRFSIGCDQLFLKPIVLLREDRPLRRELNMLN